jgi:hypothetical protein
MWRGKPIRFVSLKRALLSIVVGFMCPVGFVLTLAFISYFTRRKPSQNFAMLVAWPRLLWDLLVDQPRSEAHRPYGLLFIVACDTVVYGAITYVILTAVSVVKPKVVVLESPPTPEEFHSEPTNSD